MMWVIEPDQGYSLTLVPKTHLTLLLVNPESTLYPALQAFAGTLRSVPNFFVVPFPRTLDEEQQHYARKLRVLALPELREYRDGRLFAYWRGMREISNYPKRIEHGA